MSKKFFSPFIVLGINPGGDESGSTDETGTGPVPTPAPPNGTGATSFANWAASFGVDVNGDGAVDFSDYGQWWADQGFGMDAWEEFNPGTPFSWGPDADM